MSDRVLEVIQAGRVPYGEALEWQRRLAQDRIAGRLAHDVLLLLEHPPVITLGRNSHAAHVLADGAGIEVFEIERGGDVTYHGPGQLVGYPIVDLRALDEDVVRYVRLLENTLIDALGAFGIAAGRVRGYPGVWVGEAKIAAIGVAVKRKVTMHGFALNVAPDLDHFTVINACGLGKPVTSMKRLLKRPVPVGEVQPVVARAFGAAFSMAPAPIALETVQARAGEVALPGSGESPRAVAHRG